MKESEKKVGSLNKKEIQYLYLIIEWRFFFCDIMVYSVTCLFALLFS